MKRIGYFGEAGYTTIGEPYKTKVVESMPRYKGAQFQTNPQFVGDTRRGCNGNGLFGKAPALFNVSLSPAWPCFSVAPTC